MLKTVKGRILKIGCGMALASVMLFAFPNQVKAAGMRFQSVWDNRN